MNIGILTLPFNNNYGGYLQCYALMTILKQNGYDVELIYRRHKKAPAIKKIVPTLKNLVKMLLGRNVISIIPDEEKSFRSNGASMMPFLDGRITPKSKPLYTTGEFNKYITGRYDAVIVGSDQVWRPEYGSGIRDYFFYGIQDDNLIRLSYAASFGTDDPLYTVEELNDCGKALEKFKGISIREESGLNVIKKFGGNLMTKPQLVLDPTLLLTAEDYNKIINEIVSPSMGKVFCYVLDTNSQKDAIINVICSRLNKEKYVVSDIQSCNASLPSIESWLSAIRDSDFVITDSFHGMVFSVIFQKEFIVCPNMKRGGVRFKSFLGTLGLDNRIIENEMIRDLSPIDWRVVSNKLTELKDQSIRFLIGNLQ